MCVYKIDINALNLIYGFNCCSILFVEEVDNFKIIYNAASPTIKEICFYKISRCFMMNPLKSINSLILLPELKFATEISNICNMTQQSESGECGCLKCRSFKPRKFISLFPFTVQYKYTFCICLEFFCP